MPTEKKPTRLVPPVAVRVTVLDGLRIALRLAVERGKHEIAEEARQLIAEMEAAEENQRAEVIDIARGRRSNPEEHGR